MASEKQASFDWDRFRQGVRKSTPVDLLETPEEQKKRIARLEADPQEWKKYYFPKYFKHPSPKFHLTSSERLLKKFGLLRHWYEVRNWARGLSKSTTAMFDVLFLVLTGKLNFIMLVSSTYDAAEAFLTKYQCQLDSNDRLINDYGKQELPGSWRQGDFTTRKGVRFMALGARQSPRGESNEEIRPDCLIIDDFDTDEECRNGDIIQQKWDWFEKALFFTVDLASPFLVLWLGNIIAEDCCIVRAGKVADHRETINIRDGYGKSVWPEKNREEDIDYQISKVTWAASQQEMFNNPVRPGQTFTELKYGKCPPIDTLPFVITYADPATSNQDKPSAKSKAQNSCKAVGVIGSPDGKTFYVYKAWVDNTNNGKFIDWIYFADQYIRERDPERKVPKYAYIENNSLQDPFYQQVLKPLIKEKESEHGMTVPVSEDKRDKPGKFFRIEANLEPLNRAGKLILNEEEKDDLHMKRLHSQFIAVSPNCKTMDGPDMVEGGVFKVKEKLVTTAPGGMYAAKRKPHSKRY